MELTNEWQQTTLRIALKAAHDEYLETGQPITLDLDKRDGNPPVHVTWDQMRRMWKRIGLE